MTQGILLVVFLIGLVTFHLLERWRRPVIAGRRTGPVRPDYLAEFTSAIVDGPVLTNLTKIAAYSLITLAPRYSNVLAHWNWWLQLAVFFLISDFGRYWLHRWYHESDLLWRIHRVHHTVTEMDALSTFRVHIFEGVIKYGLLVLPFYLFGLDRWVLVLYSSIDILKGFWHHANLRTHIGPLNYFLNSPELHWWHHSVEARGQRANYGSTLSIWDWLFKTAYWPRGEWPNQIGVRGLEQFPRTYHEMLVSVRYDNESAERVYAAASEPPSATLTSSTAGASDSQTSLQTSPAGA